MKHIFKQTAITRCTVFDIGCVPTLEAIVRRWNRNCLKEAVSGQPPRYAPPSPPPWAPKRLAPPSRRQRSSSFPRPTRSHPTAAAAWCANTEVSKAAWWPWPLTFWCWKWYSSHVWRGYLSANFGLPRLLCSQLRPDVRDGRQTDRRQTDVRQHHRLMPPPIRVGA